MKPLVFLHGWAQSRQIWFQQFDAFPDALFLNLPGHGAHADVASADWLETIQAQLPSPCVLVGWSLGGMLALKLAEQFPQSIAALALISTSPCFRQQPNWPAGCDEQLFSAFEQAVSSPSPRLLNRFFSLMLHGDTIKRSAYNQLAKQAIDRDHPASSQGLHDGLEWLTTLDTRQTVQRLSMPTLLLHGRDDAIVSAASTDWLAETIRTQQKHLFEHCGHAPFLTQPERFNTTLKDWWITL